MYALSNPIFWLYFLYFIVAAFFAFYVPGNVLIRKLKADLVSEMVLSIVTGFAIWSLAGFLFGYLHLRNFIYVYLVVSLVVWMKSRGYTLLQNIPKFKLSISIIIVILLGTLIQLASVWLNGVVLRGGAYFCCGIPDTITHLSLTSELVRNFPPNEPGFSGIPLTNYHYLSNLGVADLVRTFRLPLVSTQYQYMTVLFSLLLGLSAIALSRALGLGKRFTLWLAFFLYFAGDILFLLPPVFGKAINFSFTTLENASSLWVSPPRFYALVVLLTGLTLFVHWLKKKDLYTGVIMAIVLGTLIGFKVYVGTFVLSGFGVLGIWYVIRKKYSLLLPLVVLCIISAVLYIPVNKGAGGLVFTGFWRFEDFIVQPALGAAKLELARRVFLDHYDFIRAFFYDILFGLFYIVFSTGTLLVGFLQTKSSLQKIPKELAIVLITGLISTCAAGFFFLQTTGGANSSQFLISIYIVGSIYAALAVSSFTKKLPLLPAVIVSVLIITLTSTRVLYETYLQGVHLTHKSGVFIQNDTVRAYTYFSTTPKDSVVIVYNDASMDCLLITFIGERSTYSCTIGMPGVISDRILSLRSSVQEAIFFGKNLTYVEQELKRNAISYLYVPKDSVKNTNIGKLNLQKVYETNAAIIYKVLK